MKKFIIRTDVGGPRIEFQRNEPWLAGVDSVRTLNAILHIRHRVLIICAAVWSKYDIDAIQTAVDTLRPHSSDIALGIVPFDDYAEVAAVVPWYVEGSGDGYGAVVRIRGLDVAVDATRGANPIWILCKESQPVAAVAGVLSADAVHRFAMQ